MATSKLSKFWIMITILLVVIIIAGGLVVWSQYGSRQPVEISISNPPSQEDINYIYIGGAVGNPGFYPLMAADSIEAILQAAGGTTTSADPGRLNLYVPTAGEEGQPQKVNINQAEAWLLEALPGIGETRAQAIVDYRHQGELFRDISELTKVEGLGISTYENLKDLITVAD